MEEQKDSMTPKEQMLIGQLQELLSAAEKTATALRNTREELDDRERETAALRRSMIELKEENQHLAPKGEYFDDLVARNLLTNFTKVAHQLNIKRKTFTTVGPLQ